MVGDRWDQRRVLRAVPACRRPIPSLKNTGERALPTNILKPLLVAPPSTTVLCAIYIAVPLHLLPGESFPHHEAREKDERLEQVKPKVQQGVSDLVLLQNDRGYDLCSRRGCRYCGCTHQYTTRESKIWSTGRCCTTRTAYECSHAQHGHVKPKIKTETKQRNATLGATCVVRAQL